jgi:hypothetical protein
MDFHPVLFAFFCGMPTSMGLDCFIITENDFKSNEG